jgi:hypothetical protein
MPPFSARQPRGGSRTAPQLVSHTISTNKHLQPAERRSNCASPKEEGDKEKEREARGGLDTWTIGNHGQNEGVRFVLIQDIKACISCASKAELSQTRDVSSTANVELDPALDVSSLLLIKDHSTLT